MGTRDRTLAVLTSVNDQSLVMKDQALAALMVEEMRLDRST